MFRALSPKFKQTPLVVTPGNHDIWVAGGPGSDSDRYDQFGHGFMQVCAGVWAAGGRIICACVHTCVHTGVHA